MVTKKSEVAELRSRIRVTCGEAIVLGPGKAELLQHIAETGSLNQAAKLMRMSYMRAWLLVGIMNRSFKKPVLAAMERGGKNGGGAALTKTGEQVLSLYQQMNQIGMDAIKPQWSELQRLLKKA